MKILSVTASLLGDDAASWRIWNVARLLQARGHKVHLVQYTKESTCERLKGNRLDLGDILNSVVTVPIFPISIPVAQLKHLRGLSRDNYDLVYGNGHPATCFSLLGRLKGIPLIFDMHGGVEEFLLKPNLISIRDYLLYRPIEFLNLKLSTKVYCVSKKMIEHLHTRKRVPLEKMAYVTNGVDLGFFKPANSERVQILKRQLGLEGKFVFGYIGGFQKWQGVESFIEAAKMLHDPELVFLMTGVGGEKELKKNILFIPVLPRSQMPDYYSLCDVLVLPRPSHPATEIAAPTKFAEYTAMGKPVLTTDVGDAADLVRKHYCGIVVEDNSPKSLVKGILQFKEKSRVGLRVMGERSRALAEEEFDWNKVAARLHEAITDAVK